MFEYVLGGLRSGVGAVHYYGDWWVYWKILVYMEGGEFNMFLRSWVGLEVGVWWGLECQVGFLIVDVW